MTRNEFKQQYGKFRENVRKYGMWDFETYEYWRWRKMFEAKDWTGYTWENPILRDAYERRWYALKRDGIYSKTLTK